MKSLFGIFLVLVAILGCGCSGINASHSVSPLSFFLPGLVQAAPPSPAAPAITNVAQPAAPVVDPCAQVTNRNPSPP